MRNIPTYFLQGVVVLFGLVTLILMLRLPLTEGRNVSATLFQVYFNDPFLVYAYTASLAFFFALYQAFKLLRYVREGEIFSQRASQALDAIRSCSLLLVGAITLPVLYLMIVRPEDDIAGGVVTGLMLIFISLISASTATVLKQVVSSK